MPIATAPATATGALASTALREVGIGPRLAALLLDAVIAVIAFALLNLVLYKIGVLQAPEVSQPSPMLEIWQRAVSWIAFITMLCALIILAWTTVAGTPGALLMGANIVRASDGCRAGIARCTWRLAVSVALAGFGFFGAWHGRRALHDRISGTRVVREDEMNHSIAHYAPHTQ